MFKNARHIFLLTVVLLASTPVAADTLDQVRQLARQTPGLALHYLSSTQPDAGKDPANWMRWEKERIRLYRQRRDFRAIIDRLASLPDKLAAEFVDWANTERVQAMLQLRQGAQALTWLRRMLWQKRAPIPTSFFRRWRQLVIEAYLQQSKLPQALVALRRYQQDYRQDDRQWRLLSARVMLQAGQASEAERLLRKARTSQAFALYFQARLRSGSLPAKKIYQRVYRLALRNVSVNAYQLWVVAARAAEKSGRYRQAVRAWSHALLTRPRHAHSPLFRVDGKRLWTVYRHYGRILASRYQLLDGDNEAWLRKAARLDRRRPEQARAIYALLVTTTRDAYVQRKSLQKFAASLARRRSYALLIPLFLESGSLASVDDLPAPVRHKLVDRALKKSDFRLASKLMGSLTRPPRKAGKLFWNMRRARILILGGDHLKGVEAVRQILQDNPSMKPRQIDRLMQVIFDLQAVGRHKEAIALFGQLPVKPNDSRRQREILFWQADSWKAMRQYENAARYYLRSATLLHVKAMDPWAQTARYHAAEALLSAGLLDDAGAIFRQLLRVTKDKSRRTVLRNKLHQLTLQRSRRKQ